MLTRSLPLISPGGAAFGTLSRGYPRRLGALRADLRSLDDLHRPRCYAPLGSTFSCSSFSFPKLSVLVPTLALDCGLKNSVGLVRCCSLSGHGFLGKTEITRFPHRRRASHPLLHHSVINHSVKKSKPIRLLHFSLPSTLSSCTPCHCG